MDATRFEAITMKDAIKKVKQELGRDAVIISTKEMTKPLAPGGRPQRVIEVLATPAATLAGQSSNTPSKPRPDGRRISKPIFPKIATREAASIVKSGNGPAGTLPPLSSHPKAQLTQNSSGKAAPDAYQDTTTVSVGQHTASLQEVQKVLQAQIEHLKSELKSIPQVNLSEQVQEMKIMLYDILRSQHAGNQKTKEPHPEVEELAIKLRAAGVLPSIISDLSRFLNQQNTTAPTSESNGSIQAGADFVLAAAIRYILKEVRVTNSAFGATGSQELHAFIGPSGSGKTTSIAKIASYLAKRKGLRICLVSLDAVKVGAAENLRVFGKILGLEFAEVRDVQELEYFAQKRYDLDVILVDTVGRPANLKPQHDFIRELKNAILPIKFHVLLAASMKNRDMEETLRAYQFVNPTSVVFSKLDESWSFGEIFNMSSIFKVPTSFFGTGPNIPDDLEIATKERVIERLLRI